MKSGKLPTFNRKNKAPHRRAGLTVAEGVIGGWD
jgi:hypothetical protein